MHVEVRSNWLIHPSFQLPLPLNIKPSIVSVLYCMPFGKYLGCLLYWMGRNRFTLSKVLEESVVKEVCHTGTANGHTYKWEQKASILDVMLWWCRFGAKFINRNRWVFKVKHISPYMFWQNISVPETSASTSKAELYPLKSYKMALITWELSRMRHPAYKKVLWLETR